MWLLLLSSFSNDIFLHANCGVCVSAGSNNLWIHDNTGKQALPYWILVIVDPEWPSFIVSRKNNVYVNESWDNQSVFSTCTVKCTMKGENKARTCCCKLAWDRHQILSLCSLTNIPAQVAHWLLFAHGQWYFQRKHLVTESKSVTCDTRAHHPM